MTEEYKIISEAKKSVKAHIQFFKLILEHLNGTDKALRSKACFTAWCMHRYINDQLMQDITTAILESTPAENIQ